MMAMYKNMKSKESCSYDVCVIKTRRVKTDDLVISAY